MSISAINWALNVVTGITSTQKAVLVALADRADVNGCCYPSYDDICRRSCATRNAVSNALKTFESLGLLTKDKRFSKSTVYTLHISTEMHTAKSSTVERISDGTDEHISDGTQNHTLTTIEPPKEPSPFDEFWKAYPKRVAKPQAERAFNRLSKKDQKALMSALSGYPFSTEKRYIPNPATFINQRRWEDEQDITTNFRGIEI